MSKIVIIEEEIEACWECPNLGFNGGGYICAEYRNATVDDISDIPGFCPLEDFGDE